MRTIILGICLLIANLSIKAQLANGIRIDGGNTPILVYMNGKQICIPTHTCFIANLTPQHYLIEVYETRMTQRGQPSWKGKQLFRERIYFNGNEIKEIQIKGSQSSKPHPIHNHHHHVMDAELFNSFYQTVKEESFENKMIKAIETALITTDFTCEQCERLLDLFNFDSKKVELMKQMYPQIVDKEAFFTVINTLDFSSNKEEMKKFIKQYHK